MQVIEAQCASILEPHDHLHISHKRIVPWRAGVNAGERGLRDRFAVEVGHLYCPIAALNLATSSAGTRPRSFTSMP